MGEARLVGPTATAPAVGGALADWCPDPQAPLQRLRAQLTAEEARLDQRRHDLAQTRADLERLAGSVGVGAVARGSSLRVEPLDPADAVQVVMALVTSSRGPVRNCVMTVDYGPALDAEMIRVIRERVAAGKVHRSIYPMDVAATTTGRRWLDGWAEVGEEQRLLANPPSEFIVTDDGVVAVQQWGEPESAYLLMREPMLVRAFESHFDALWARGVPQSAQAASQTERLLELMSGGLKDESIARLTGWSVRTVRRRVAALMDQHGVQTRFQLGAAVCPSGRVRPEGSAGAPVRARPAGR